MGHVTYTLDRDATVVAVGGDWDAFAAANDGPSPAAVIGRGFRDVVGCASTRELFLALFEHVRTRGEIVELPFRCDSPRARRLHRAQVARLADGLVEVRCETLQEVAVAAPLLDARATRSEWLLAMCSWCKAVDLDGWTELGDALARRPELSSERPPALTHGICPACEARLLAELPGRL